MFSSWTHGVSRRGSLLLSHHDNQSGHESPSLSQRILPVLLSWSQAIGSTLAAVILAVGALYAVVHAMQGRARRIDVAQAHVTSIHQLDVDAAARMVRQRPSDVNVVSATEKPFYDHNKVTGQENILRRHAPNAKMRGTAVDVELAPPPINVLAPPPLETAAYLKFENRLGEEVLVKPDGNRKKGALVAQRGNGWERTRRVSENSKHTWNNPKIPNVYQNGFIVCTPKMAKKGMCLQSPPPPPEPPFGETVDGFIVCGPDKIKNADCVAPSPPPTFPNFPTPPKPPAPLPPPLPAYPPAPDATSLKLTENKARWEARKRMEDVKAEESRREVDEKHLETRDDVRLRKEMREHHAQNEVLVQGAAEAQREAALLQARAAMAQMKARNLTLNAEVHQAHLDQKRSKLAPSAKEFEQVWLRETPRGKEHDADVALWKSEPGSVQKQISDNMTDSYYPPSWSGKWKASTKYQDAEDGLSKAAVESTARAEGAVDQFVSEKLQKEEETAAAAAAAGA
ncbi:hypothetical protein RI054_17g80050 [Pseudoscourfieldia marina]